MMNCGNREESVLLGKNVSFEAVINRDTKHYSLV